MFITYSGSTQELLMLLPHLDEALPTILITSHTRHDTCKFMTQRPNTILLPAPVHEPEKTSFGVAAPTTSTTAALALGDAVAITIAAELHPSPAKVFATNHPGGAIGVAAKSQPQNLQEIAIPWTEITVADIKADSRGVDLLLAAYDSPNGWVRAPNDLVASPSAIRAAANKDSIRSALVSRPCMLEMSYDTTIRRARDILRDALVDADDEADNVSCALGSVISVTKNGDIVGVLEIRDVLEYATESSAKSTR
ncbi:hypothetical protein Golomagni_07543 [Golovinomyces magnicellulatus]|nr:hypothetical protein Golomagni_07543 [Golovinomyces magnicellulatus]